MEVHKVYHSCWYIFCTTIYATPNPHAPVRTRHRRAAASLDARHGTGTTGALPSVGHTSLAPGPSATFEGVPVRPGDQPSPSTAPVTHFPSLPTSPPLTRRSPTLSHLPPPHH